MKPLLQPPRLADRLLRLVCAPHRLEEVQGDLHEEFAYQVERVGERRARWRYWWDVLGFVRPFAMKRKKQPYSSTSSLHPVMLRNYLKIALRNLQKNKVAGLINVSGLTLGLTCCLLIAAYVLDDLTYDQFHQNADRIVLFQQFDNSASSGGKFATDLKSRFTAISDAVRLTRIKPLISRQQAAFYEPNFWFADSSVVKVFTLPFVQGNPRTALTEQYGLVLSETMARKYFGTMNPMGQQIRFNNKATLHVTGVLQDLPANSHLKIDFLANYANANELVGYDVTTNYWGGGDTWTYLLLAPGADKSTLQAQFPAYIKQLGDPNASVWKPKLVPLTDIYLRTTLVATNRLLYVYVFAIVALLILGLACFNYVNLATARATQRAKEVGVRKVLGSSFGQLWGQFLGETAVFMTIAIVLSAGVMALALPAFNELADKQLTMVSLLTGPRVGWLLVGLFLVGLLAGSYPAFVLSSFRPIAVLKGSTTIQGRMLTGGSAWLRKTLVVGQFAVSIGMIAATLVVYEQLQFVQSRNVGYQRDQVLTLDLQDAPDPAKELFKQQVASLPGVEAATRAFSLPGSGSLRGEKLVSDYVPKGSQTGGISRLTIDGDFLKTFGIKLVEGRNLDPNRPADKQAFLVNRAAMKYFGWKTITGKMTGYYTYAYDSANPGSYREVPQRGEVVGVIDDYNHANLKQTVEPTILSLNTGFEGQLAARIRAGAIPGTIQQVEQLWRKAFPEKPFSYEFLDDTFNQTYKVEARTGQVFGLFAGLAVLISCLGLFGLVTFTAEQRTKEIGVRKVLGASVVSIVTLLSKDFLTLVFIALVIASPVAWWAMTKWLQDFAYRVDIAWWVFVLAGGLVTGVALITISFQSIKAALMNPVKSLRSE
jgi:putative ABC transport system permease protein